MWLAGGRPPLRRDSLGALASSVVTEASLNSVHDAPLITRVLQGIALAAFVTVFGLALDPSRRAGLTFGQVLMMVPLTAAAGGFGGAAYFALDPLRAAGGWRRTVANVLSLLAYCAAALLLVLGLYARK